MKGIYISVALLLAVLLIALFYMLAIANVSSSFAMAAVEVQQFIEQDNMEAAGFKVDEIEQQWSSSRIGLPYLSIIAKWRKFSISLSE